MLDWPELERLRTARGKPYAIELTPQTRRPVDPAAVIEAYADGARPIVLWGSWLGDEVIIAVDPLVERGGLSAADCWQPLRTWPQLSRRLTDGIGGGWFAALGYDPGTSWLAFADAVLRGRPDGTWAFESLGLTGREDAAAAALARARAALQQASQCLRSAPSGPAIGHLAPVGGSPVAAADEHLAGVERVIGRIRAGEVYQLNLCTRLTGELMVEPLELFVRTVTATRPAYGAYLPTGTGTGPGTGTGSGTQTSLISLSPERFVTVRDGRVTTSPIKGTTKRSEDPDGSRLRRSAKDAAENVMITDLMRNDLSRVCTPGSVAVTGLLEVRPHPGVWHLVSTVTGELAPGVAAADLLAATFPPGSVTGAPKSSAVRAIAVEERQPRGVYTGAAGLLTPDGRAELSVLIRTFEVSGRRVELGVGGGITVDSVPVREWWECLHKAEPLARAAGSALVAGLHDRPAPAPPELLAGGVFESILAQHGRPLRLADHLARLARSVRELYDVDLPADLPARVTAAARERSGDARSALRVVARPGAEDGVEVAVTTRLLGPRLAGCTLALADRSAVAWRHKWADRTELSAAEEETAPALPYFLDAAGRLAETSRGNLFVLGVDDIWRTPPAGEDLLPGVTRRALLDALGDRGVPVEIVPLTPTDLAAARSVVWTSSLSGVVAVESVDGRRLETGEMASTWTRRLSIRVADASG